jgi:hypothetical protein
MDDGALDRHVIEQQTKTNQSMIKQNKNKKTKQNGSAQPTDA